MNNMGWPLEHSTAISIITLTLTSCSKG
jgi:hypothetical protein